MPGLFVLRHNPYFNRWFSAIGFKEIQGKEDNVTILILIDGFLQFVVVFVKFKR